MINKKEKEEIYNLINKINGAFIISTLREVDGEIIAEPVRRLQPTEIKVTIKVTNKMPCRGEFIGE